MLLRHLLNDYFCDVAASDGAQISVEEFKDHPRLVSGKLIQGKPWDVITYRKDSCALQFPSFHSR